MSLFHRIHSDRTETSIALENQFAGSIPSACWLVGGGPSLGDIDVSLLRSAPIPVLSINLAGTHLLRPDFWTSYDPSARFHKSIYLDPGVTKFLHRRRATDLVPETTYKVGDCPNTVFFERDGNRGFADFLSPAHTGIVDWADSMVQAVDILYRLGFRTIYLVGCEMRIDPTPAQQNLARQHGVEYDETRLLADFVKQCADAGLSVEELETTGPSDCYHFDETKPLRAAVNTDRHYFRIAQSLRLCRRSLALAGMHLVSATPRSRLNDYFPYRSVPEIVAEGHAAFGNPADESTRGRYREDSPRTPPLIGPMRDFRPHNWPQTPTPEPAVAAAPAVEIPLPREEG